VAQVLTQSLQDGHVAVEQQLQQLQQLLQLQLLQLLPLAQEQRLTQQTRLVLNLV
jgi:hypothetical protein